MDLLKECVQYFKSNDNFERLFVALQKKWQHYGRGVGAVVLKDTTVKEREAIGGFLNCHFEHDNLRIPVRDFEAALAESQFSDITLQMLLESYFAVPLETKRHYHLRRKEEQNDYFANLAATCQEETASWLNIAREEKRWGYGLLRAGFRQDKELLERNIQAIDQLSQMLKDSTLKRQRLAVVSAAVSGNPHYFDYAMQAGKLLVAFLSCRQHIDEPHSAEERLELYYSVGLKPDDLSSSTLLYGISLYLPDGPHPAYEGFIQYHEPYAVNLLNLDKIVRADCQSKRVYIFENQTVFSDLCVEAGVKDQAFMCTSSQVRTASLLVLDLLAAAGCQLYYAGDLDTEGILIADKIIRRHPDCTFSWHMTPDDYAHCKSDETITESRLKQLENVTDADLKELTPVLWKYRKAGYQELLLDQMLTDLRK
jgi:uncharacterized protein (TIGR02679 family)